MLLLCLSVAYAVMRWWLVGWLSRSCIVSKRRKIYGHSCYRLLFWATVYRVTKGASWILGMVTSVLLSGAATAAAHAADTFDNRQSIQLHVWSERTTLRRRASFTAARQLLVTRDLAHLPAAPSPPLPSSPPVSSRALKLARLLQSMFLPSFVVNSADRRWIWLLWSCRRFHQRTYRGMVYLTIYVNYRNQKPRTLWSRKCGSKLRPITLEKLNGF